MYFKDSTLRFPIELLFLIYETVTKYKKNEKKSSNRVISLLLHPFWRLMGIFVHNIACVQHAYRFKKENLGFIFSNQIFPEGLLYITY